VKTAEIAGFKRIIGFDVGGTSTDVWHYDGEYERVLHTEVAGVRMRAPMMKIHTVAAGDGSLLGFDGARTGPSKNFAAPTSARWLRVMFGCSKRPVMEDVGRVERRSALYPNSLLQKNYVPL